MIPVYTIEGARGATGKTGAQKRVKALSQELSLPLASEIRDSAGVLCVSRDRLSVVFKDASGEESELQVDWSRLDTASQAGGSLRQPLIRAVLGRKRPCSGTVVLDCTAGLGRDAWILAALGCSVVAVERHPLIYALLRDSLARAGIYHPAATRRMRLCHAEAREILTVLAVRNKGEAVGAPAGFLPAPDAVYLDPMFPGHEKRKTAEKKSMRLLRTLVGGLESDQSELLGLSLAAARSRVILKRPEKAPVLLSGAVRPLHQIHGRGMRFDIYASAGGQDRSHAV